jgi:hypothetical protein
VVGNEGQVIAITTGFDQCWWICMGAMALAFMYDKLKDASMRSTRQFCSFASLLQVCTINLYYITHFNNEVLEVKNVESNLVLYFFVEGLRQGAFPKHLEFPTDDANVMN